MSDKLETDSAPVTGSPSSNKEFELERAISSLKSWMISHPSEKPDLCHLDFCLTAKTITTPDFPFSVRACDVREVTFQQ